MDIKIGEKVVGSMYINLQLPLDAFEVRSYETMLDMVRGTNGHDKLVLELPVGKCVVGTFRRIYKDTEKLCIEGAELVAV